MFSRRYVFYWNSRTKRKVALLCASIATVGGIIGFTVGRVTAQKTEETEYIPPTEPTVIEEPTLGIVEIQPKYYDIPLDNSIQDYIRKLCENHNLPMELVIALIECESSFRPNVVSKTGDYGLMQINQINHKWLSEKYGITDFLDPRQNILCGVSILADHYSRFGDTHKALMAYNMGATGARKQWDNGNYTSAYSIKVVEAMKKYTEDNQMCDICLSTPCLSRCPNAKEQPVVCICVNCGYEIYEGDGMYEVGEEKWCESCMRDCYTIAEVETYD